MEIIPLGQAIREKFLDAIYRAMKDKKGAPAHHSGTEKRICKTRALAIINIVNTTGL